MNTKLKLVLIIGIILVSNQIIMAQETKPCPCCSEEYNQFDYWIGNWEVYDTSGTKVGTNNIEKLMDGCIVKENWTSTGKHRGTSYNFYNRTDKSWNQIWVDNQGTVLDLKGELVNKVMTLKSAQTKDQEGNVIYHQITWKLQKDGSVIQIWDVIDAQGNVKSNLFTGIYRKNN